MRASSAPLLATDKLDLLCNRFNGTYGVEGNGSLPLERFSNWSMGGLPFSQSCLESKLAEISAQMQRYTDGEVWIYSILYAIISAVAIVGNGLVIFAVVRKPAMRTNRNVLICNLAIANLVLAVTNIPLLWYPSIDIEFPYPSILCSLGNALPGLNVYCSTLTISVMAIDRYYVVTTLVGSGGALRKTLSSAFSIAAIWLSSLALSMPLILYYDTPMLWLISEVYVYDDRLDKTSVRSYGWRQCRMVADRLGTMNEEEAERAQKNIQLLVSVLQALFLYIIPLIVLSIFNFRLTHFLRLNEKTSLVKQSALLTRRSTGSGGGGTNIRRATPPTNSGYKKVELVPLEPSSDSGPSARELSSFSLIPPPLGALVPSGAAASDRVSARRSRTTVMLYAMAASYAFLWLPFTIVTAMIDLNIFEEMHMNDTLERIDQSCKVLSLLSICANPFLYGYLNTIFAREFKEIYYTYVLCRRAHQNPTNGGGGGGNTTGRSHSAAGAKSSRSLFEMSSTTAALRRTSLAVMPMMAEDENGPSVLMSVRRALHGSLLRIRGSLHSDLQPFSTTRLPHQVSLHPNGVEQDARSSATSACVKRNEHLLTVRVDADDGGDDPQPSSCNRSHLYSSRSVSTCLAESPLAAK